MVQSQSLKPESVAEIPENILPEFSLILLEGRENACHEKSKPQQLISDLALLSGKKMAKSWGNRRFHFNY